jgi:hypothetical protein
VLLDRLARRDELALAQLLAQLRGHRRLPSMQAG